MYLAISYVIDNIYKFTKTLVTKLYQHHEIIIGFFLEIWIYVFLYLSKFSYLVLFFYVSANCCGLPGVGRIGMMQDHDWYKHILKGNRRENNIYNSFRSRRGVGWKKYTMLGGAADRVRCLKWLPHNPLYKPRQNVVFILRAMENHWGIKRMR